MVAHTVIACLAASAIIFGCSCNRISGATGSASGQTANTERDDRTIARDAEGRTAKIRFYFEYESGPQGTHGNIEIDDKTLMVTNHDEIEQIIAAFEHTKLAQTRARLVTEPRSSVDFFGPNGASLGGIAVIEWDLDRDWSPEVKRLYLKYRHRWVLRERAKGSKIKDLK